MMTLYDMNVNKIICHWRSFHSLELHVYFVESSIWKKKYAILIFMHSVPSNVVSVIDILILIFLCCIQNSFWSVSAAVPCSKLCLWEFVKWTNGRQIFIPKLKSLWTICSFCFFPFFDFLGKCEQKGNRNHIKLQITGAASDFFYAPIPNYNFDQMTPDAFCPVSLYDGNGSDYHHIDKTIASGIWKI